MANNEVKITIHQNDLGAEPEFGLTDDDIKLFDAEGDVRVKLYVDGKLVESEEKTADSVTIKLPAATGGEMLTVTATDASGKILNVLHYNGEERIPDEDPDDDEDSDLIGAIEALADRIAATIPKEESLVRAIESATEKILAAIRTGAAPARQTRADTRGQRR